MTRIWRTHRTRRAGVLAAWMVAAMAAAGCAGVSGEYGILSASLDPPVVAPGGSTELNVSVGKTSGRQQVQGTEELTVSVRAPDGVQVTPVVIAYEQPQEDGSLKITMRPGGVLPRTFRFKLAPKPDLQPGQYPVEVKLHADGKESTARITLEVR